MAATSPKKSTFTPGLEAAHDRTYEAGDRLAEVSRKLATAYLDGIEKYVADFAKLERKLGEQTKLDAVGSLISAHAQLTEEVAQASVSAARGLISV